MHPIDEPRMRDAGYWAPGGKATGPLAPVARARDSRRRLAALLEEIADGLPDRAGPAAMATAVEQLRGLAEAEGGGVEARFAAFVIDQLSFNEPLRTALRDAAELARDERARARLRALELADALEALCEGDASEPPGAIGYLLRAWFEAERMTLDWEAAAVLRPGCAALSEAALREFSAPCLTLINGRG